MWVRKHMAVYNGCETLSIYKFYSADLEEFCHLEDQDVILGEIIKAALQQQAEC